MHKKARMICFTVIASLVFSSVFIVVAAVHLGVQFPSWTHVYDKTLLLERRSRADFTAPSPGNLLDGSFQDSCESYFSDHVPERDAALLVNAYLERLGIRTASKVFGYDAEHAFYGSKYVLVPDDGVVAEQSLKAPGHEDKRDKYINALNAVSRNHPEISMAVDFITEPRHSKANPACDLMGRSTRLTEDWIQAELVDKLDPALHARVDGLESYEQLKEDWYHTDVHWTAKRAVESYNSIAETLGLKLVDWRDDDEIVAKDRWWGAAGRSARVLECSDSLVDLNIDFSNLKFYKVDAVSPGEEITSGLRDRFISGEITSSNIPRFGLNGRYFGGKNYEIINEGDNNGKTCLLLGDSFVRPMFRYIADNYARTIMLLPGNYKVEGTLEELVDKYDPDDMIVVMHCQKYKSIASKSPGLLESE